MKRSRAELETILRWSEDQKQLDIYTASERVRKRLSRKGFQFTAIDSHSWRASGIELDAVRFRHVGPDGAVVRKKAPTHAFTRQDASSSTDGADGEALPVPDQTIVATDDPVDVAGQRMRALRLQAGEPSE